MSEEDGKKRKHDRTNEPARKKSVLNKLPSTIINRDEYRLIMTKDLLNTEQRSPFLDLMKTPLTIEKKKGLESIWLFKTVSKNVLYSIICKFFLRLHSDYILWKVSKDGIQLFHVSGNKKWKLEIFFRKDHIERAGVYVFNPMEPVFLVLEPYAISDIFSRCERAESIEFVQKETGWIDVEAYDKTGNINLQTKLIPVLKQPEDYILELNRFSQEKEFQGRRCLALVINFPNNENEGWPKIFKRSSDQDDKVKIYYDAIPCDYKGTYIDPPGNTHISHNITVVMETPNRPPCKKPFCRIVKKGEDKMCYNYDEDESNEAEDKTLEEIGGFVFNQAKDMWIEYVSYEYKNFGALFPIEFMAKYTNLIRDKNLTIKMKFYVVPDEKNIPEFIFVDIFSETYLLGTITCSILSACIRQVHQYQSFQ